MRKWFTSWVFPGVWEVFASLELPVSMLMRELFPTLERPMNANSGRRRWGFCPTRVLLPENSALVILMDRLLNNRAKIRIIEYLCNMEMDEKFMREALREAEAARAQGEIPIGAVVVWKGRIIGRGHNETERLRDTTAHAEMIAITAASEAMGGKYLTDCTLYVTVEPCPMCAGALAWSQISRIVYGAPDVRRGYSLFTPSLLHPRTQTSGGVLQEECAALMLDFFKSKR